MPYTLQQKPDFPCGETPDLNYTNDTVKAENRLPPAI